MSGNRNQNSVSSGLGFTSVTNEPREIAAGIWWIPACLSTMLEGKETHVHAAPFLIVSSEKTLLWDTAPPIQWPDVERSLDQILGDRPLDYLVVSHPEVAHGGSVARVLERYPDAQLLGDLQDYPLFFPHLADRMVSHPLGEPLDLGSHRITLVEALLKDLPNTVWAYESAQQVLFVADGFAYSHRPPLEDDDRPTHVPGECASLASELGEPPSAAQVVWITKSALYWTRFVRMDSFVQRMEALLSRYPSRLLAPAHGAVIDELDTNLPLLWEALETAYSPDTAVKFAGAITGRNI